MQRETHLGDFDLPEQWHDYTVHKYVWQETAPRLPAAIATDKIEAPRATVLLSSAELPEGKSISDYADYQLGILKQAPGFSQQSREPWPHPDLGDLVALDVVYEVAPGVPVRQLQVFMERPGGAQLISFVLTALPAMFQRAREQFDRVVNEFQPRAAAYPTRPRSSSI